jgi:deazaflavin-dependent oxidoreductase (nitroreductase family)
MGEQSLPEILKKRRQISITVIGRRTGREITLPVWFVVDDKSVWLLPVYGSKTQWFRNLGTNRAIAIRVGKDRYDLQARLLKDAATVRGVIERFRGKYTAEEIKRWYTGLDAAVQVPFSTAKRSGADR